MKGGLIMFRRVVHPGGILKDELAELGVTPTEFARQIAVPANRVSQIIAGKRSITGDTALRFGHWFGTDPQFWLNLQVQFDLAVADRQVGRPSATFPPGPNRRSRRRSSGWEGARAPVAFQSAKPMGPSRRSDSSLSFFRNSSAASRVPHSAINS